MGHYLWDFISINLKILKITGLWPDGENYGRDLYTLYSIISINVFINFHNFSQLMSIPFISNDLEALTSTVFVSLTDCLVTFKVYYYTKNMRMLKQLKQISADTIFELKTQHQRTIAEEGLASWKFICIAFTAPVVFTLCLWALYPILDGTVKDHRLPFIAWYPFDAKKSPMYAFTYLYQVIAIWFMAIANVNLDMLMAALMVFIAIQCDVLSDNLRNMGNDSESLFNRDLIRCVNHHRELLSFAKNSNRCFDMIIVGQLFTSAVSIGLTLFQLSVVKPFTGLYYSFVLYGTSMTVQIFLYCWFGNEVLYKSEKISYAALESFWINAPIEAKKNLIFFIRRAQAPIRLSAMSIFFINLQAFMKILQTSYSYFAILHQVNGDQE